MVEFVKCWKLEYKIREKKNLNGKIPEILKVGDKIHENKTWVIKFIK